MTTIKTKPEEFERRILLTLAGHSPAIITETLYALPPSQKPTEIRVITTSSGKEKLKKELLGDSGAIRRLCDEYQIRIPIFNESHIHVIAKGGIELQDIQTEEHNEITADFIMTNVRELTQDDNTSLHVSIAGGRKTMTYYLGYAMSVFGRIQDRMSHVLVDDCYAVPGFYYPTCEQHMIPTRNGESFDASAVTVTLGDLPFIRLGDGLGFAEELTQGKHTFNETIDLVQRQFAPVQVTMDSHGWHCSKITVQDPKPTRFSVYAWLLERHRNGEPPLRFYGDKPEREYAEELLAMYKRIYRIKGIDKMETALERGMTVDYLRPHLSHCNKVLKNSLKEAAQHYLIQTHEHARYAEYCLPEGLVAQDITLNF
jgi:CRISPR-associated protein (TIGR02584 family)